MIRHSFLIFAAGFLFTNCNRPYAETQPAVPLEKCRIQPFWPAALEAPKTGFIQIDEGGLSCSPVSDSAWARVTGRTFDLWINTDGPGGSGRYWTISVGITSPGASAVQRGLCFETSTVGRRTLQDFEGGSLPWTEDLDGDGNPELIAWGSFALHEEASMAEYGLMAWVYKAKLPGTLELDMPLSRKFAARIAKAYRKPFKPESPWDGMRADAAGFLESFATGRCK